MFMNEPSVSAFEDLPISILRFQPFSTSIWYLPKAQECKQAKPHLPCLASMYHESATGINFPPRPRPFWSILRLFEMARVKWLIPLVEFISLAQAAQVRFSLDLTWQRGAPNGVERDMIFVNDQFPGPALIIDEGDEVTVGFCPFLSPGQGIMDSG